MVGTVALGNNGDSAFGDREAPGAVQIVIVADFDTRRDGYVLFDDGTADLGMASHVDAGEDDRILDRRKAVDPHTGAENRTFNAPPDTIEPGQMMLSTAKPRR